MSDPQEPVRTLGITTLDSQPGAVSVAILCQDAAGQVWHFRAQCTVGELRPGFPESENERQEAER